MPVFLGGIDVMINTRAYFGGVKRRNVNGHMEKCCVQCASPWISGGMLIGKQIMMEPRNGKGIGHYSLEVLGLAILDLDHVFWY